MSKLETCDVQSPTEVIAQFRGDLATVTAERNAAVKETWTLGTRCEEADEALATERAAHEETKGTVRANQQAADREYRRRLAAEKDLESARTSLAAAEARVKAAVSPLVTSVGKCECCGGRAPLMQGAKLPSHRLQNVCVYGWGCSASKALRA